MSPLMGMDHVYSWRLTEPSERLAVHIESTRADAASRVFDATLVARAAARSAGGSWRARSPCYPLLTVRILARHLRRTPCACGCAAHATSPTPAAERSTHERDRAAQRPLGRARARRLARHGGRARVQGPGPAHAGGHHRRSHRARTSRRRRLLLGEAAERRPEGERAGELAALLPAHCSAAASGSAGSYMDGQWDCDDLVALTRIAALNVGSLDRLRRALAPAADARSACRRVRSRATRRGARAGGSPPTTTSATTCSRCSWTTR